MLTSHSVWDGSSGGIYATKMEKLLESIVEKSHILKQDSLVNLVFFPGERLNRETFHL